MSYQDLRDFLKQLESTQALHRITVEIDPYLEMTEVSDRVLQKQGPALLFENPKGNNIPVLANLFGTVDRVALALGCKDINELRSIGEFLSEFKEPTPPKGLRDAWEKYPLLKRALAMRPKIFKQGACQEIIYEAEAVDLNNLPIQTCWPQDAGPLITWGLVATRSPEHQRLNLGIYRQQVIAKNKVIMRWLSHRGGALDYQAWRRYHGKKPFPLAVIIGADPATLLAAVIPIPDTLSEYAFAGLLRGYRTELVKCLSSDILVPAQSEIVLEGFIYPEEEALEGPFGDHTGYYNEAERFPIFTINRITHRKDPIYHSTYTGRPPDEPSILGMSLNELFLPILKKQFPEIVDFYLPPEGCSYRLAIVTIKKQYPGHAKRVMMGIWSVLTQFMYTKFIVVTDDDINARNWHDVIWAITTRMDPARDTLIIENTPIDYLDFASPVSGLGSKIGFDATNKWQGETQRVWGRPINKNPDVVKKIDSIWEQLGFL